jgi:hypothetical protein
MFDNTTTMLNGKQTYYLLPPGHLWPSRPHLIHEREARNATGHIFNAQREGRGLFRTT